MDDSSRARADAIRLLKLRPRSERELSERLGRKGFAPAAINAVLQELRQKGLVDDALFARFFGMKNLSPLEEARAVGAYQAERMKKADAPAKARRLAGLLSRRGFEEDIVEQVIQEIVPDEG